MLTHPAGSLAEPRTVREKSGRQHPEKWICQLSSDLGVSFHSHPLCSAWQNHEKQQKLLVG